LYADKQYLLKKCPYLLNEMITILFHLFTLDQMERGMLLLLYIYIFVVISCLLVSQVTTSLYYLLYTHACEYRVISQNYEPLTWYICTQWQTAYIDKPHIDCFLIISILRAELHMLHSPDIIIQCCPVPSWLMLSANTGLRLVIFWFISSADIYNYVIYTYILNKQFLLIKY